jgi:hypothetical protein
MNVNPHFHEIYALFYLGLFSAIKQTGKPEGTEAQVTKFSAQRIRYELCLTLACCLSGVQFFHIV